MNHLNVNPSGEASEADSPITIHYPTISTIYVDAAGNETPAPSSGDNGPQANPEHNNSTGDYFDNATLPEVGTHIPEIDGSAQPEFILPQGASFDLTASARTMLEQANQEPLLEHDSDDMGVEYLNQFLEPDAPQDNPNSVYPPIEDPPAPPANGPVAYHELPGFETPSSEEDEPDPKERRRLRERRNRKRREAIQREITAGRMLPPTERTTFKIFTPQEHLARKKAKAARDKEYRHKKKAQKLAGGLLPASSDTTAQATANTNGTLSEAQFSSQPSPAINPTHNDTDNHADQSNYPYHQASGLANQQELPSLEDLLHYWHTGERPSK